MRCALLIMLIGCSSSSHSTSDAPTSGDGCTNCSIDADAPVARPLAYFGYWRDALTGSTAEIQDHANVSLVDDTDRIWINPLNSVIVCDDCDVLPSSQWPARKAQVEAAVASYPSASHFLINLGDGNADGRLDFQDISGFTLPTGVDWVGLECYPRLGWAGCKANLDLLKPLMPANGRFWILMPTETEYGGEDALVANARDLYTGAKSEPLVIGMIGFVWTNAILCPPADCSHVFATKELPALLTEMKCIGRAITKPGSPTDC